MNIIVKRTRYLMLAGLLASTTAMAQSDYPNRVIRLVVPFGAGGATDLVARALAEKVGNQMGQKMVVENKPGANSNIGAAIVAKAPADGYTVLYNTSGVIFSLSLSKNLPYDLFRDFAPVALTAAVPQLLVASPSLPVTKLQETIEYIRANPGKLNYASIGIGNITHLTMLLFLNVNKIDINHMQHIPYSAGTQSAVADLVEGRAHFYFGSVTFALPFIKDNRLRPIAVTSLERSERLPDVPTMNESGMPKFEAIIWQGTLVPAKTPAAVISRLNGEILKALKNPELLHQFDTLGVIALGSSPQGYGDYMKKEHERWGKIIREAKIPAE